MSEYQYYEFLAIDRPLDEGQQAQVRALSTRALITATSFSNEYHWGDFRGDPCKLMERFYDAHLYLANWGTHQVMLRLPRALLDARAVEPYLIDPYVTAWTTREHLILDLTSQDEEGEWVEGAERSLAVIAGVRTELAAGDMRALYLAWLAGYGTWERDEDAFDHDEEDELEPAVPAGLGSLTAPQRALADYLRLDDDLLAVAVQASPPLDGVGRDPRVLARKIKELPREEADHLLLQVAQGHGTGVQLELLRRLRAGQGNNGDEPGRRTVAELLDAAAEIRQERRRREEAARAAEEARRAQQRALAREKRLDAVARDREAVWLRVEALIETRKQAEYDIAVQNLLDLWAVAARDGHEEEFARRLTDLRQRHLRKPSLTARLDRAGLGATLATG
jgi:hypothetical protein